MNAPLDPGLWLWLWLWFGSDNGYDNNGYGCGSDNGYDNNYENDVTMLLLQKSP